MRYCLGEKLYLFLNKNFTNHSHFINNQVNMMKFYRCLGILCSVPPLCSKQYRYTLRQRASAVLLMMIPGQPLPGVSILEKVPQMVQLLMLKGSTITTYRSLSKIVL